VSSVGKEPKRHTGESGKVRKFGGWGTSKTGDIGSLEVNLSQICVRYRLGRDSTSEDQYHRGWRKWRRSDSDQKEAQGKKIPPPCPRGLETRESEKGARKTRRNARGNGERDDGLKGRKTQSEKRS